MPNRIVRDGILRSKAVGRLSPLAQLFYRCLQSVVDDFGRYYADLEVLLSDCFPLRPKWATEELLAEWLIECEREKLVRTYAINDTKYLEIMKFGQRIRPGSKSKFPSHADSSGFQPLYAADFGGSRESAAESGSRAASTSPTAPSHTTPTPTPNADDVFEQVPEAVEAFLVPQDKNHPEVILAELEPIYTAAGVPVSEKHKTLILGYLSDISPPQKRRRVVDYVKHSLVSGKWPNPAKTKALLKLLQSGDWDVEITPRTLGSAPLAREPTKFDKANAEAAGMLRKGRSF